MKVPIMRPLKYSVNTINMRSAHYIWLLSLLLVFSCKTTEKVSQKPVDDGTITFKFVQVNDVYEIAPLSGGKYGGMARVAHVVDSIKRIEPNTYLFMAGDFLNPSLLGTLKLNGERIAGKQMIEVMNAMNFELATFGNHEFDLKEEDLQKRLDESNFYWMSANVFQQLEDGPRSFHFVRGGDSIPVPETYTLSISDADGTAIDVGIFGVTIDSNPQDYVYYADPMLEAESAMSKLKFQQSDVIVGLTHLEIEEDVALANRFPGISLIMGGHEHHNMLVPTNHAKVAKADANAKTVYIHTFQYNAKDGSLEIDSKLFPIDETIASHPSVQQVVDTWNAILDEKVKEVVANPNEVIYRADPPLDGTDSASRGVQTNLGGFIAQGMAMSFDEPTIGALVNGGSIRVDDMMGGDITSLDIFRVLPFGGQVLKVDLTGKLLREVLVYGKSKGGTGAYLQRYGFNQNRVGAWLLGDELIEDDEVYTIAFSDFLLKGYDIPFLTPENEGVIKVYEPKETEAAFDIRKAVIQLLKNQK